MNYRDEFKKIIENIKVSRMTPPEKFNAEMQPLIHFIQNNIPAALYRFRECTEMKSGCPRHLNLMTRTTAYYFLISLQY